MCQGKVVRRELSSISGFAELQKVEHVGQSSVDSVLRSLVVDGSRLSLRVVSLSGESRETEPNARVDSWRLVPSFAEIDTQVR